MKNSTSPTHAAIAQRAQEIWNLRGSPDGHDSAIWHEAESQLRVVTPESQPPTAAVAQGQTAVKSSTEPVVAPAASSHLSVIAPDPDEIAAKAALQKQSARAPRLPRVKNAPHPAAPESGKPIWDKPHSS